MRRTEDKKRTIIITLLCFVLVLLLLGAYLLLIKPSLNGYIVLKMKEGYNIGVFDSVVSLMQQASTCQPVPITLGNQTINVIAVECLR